MENDESGEKADSSLVNTTQDGGDIYWTQFRKTVIKKQNCKECQQDGGMLCEEGILRVGGNVQNNYGREKEEPSSGVS